jgi:hypothetical protein
VTDRVAAVQESEAATPEAVPAARAAVAPGLGSPASVLALQRTAGNAAVSQLLARREGPLTAAYEAARTAKQAFVDGGKRGPITYDPSTRNKANYYGGFDVEYDPKEQEMFVTLRGVVDFRAGLAMQGSRAVAREGSKRAREAADKINKDFKAADRPAEVTKWQWSKKGGPDAGDETKFMTDFEQSVGLHWSYEHGFVCTREYWEDLGASVDVTVDLDEMDATHKPGKPYHMTMVVFKVPAGFEGEAHVDRAGGAKGGAFANTLTLTSADTELRSEKFLKRTFEFDAGKTALSKDLAERFGKLAKNMPNAPKGATAPVADLTVTVQGADATERQARFDAVAAVATKAGMDASRLIFVDGGTGNSATLVVGDEVRQITAVHESGHMFGLDDEYVNPSNAEYGAGKKTEHTDLAAKAGQTGIVHGISDNVMSMGGKIRRQHYVTFLDALKVVTGIEQWDFGDAQDVQAPLPYLDGPGPAVGGPQKFYV